MDIDIVHLTYLGRPLIASSSYCWRRTPSSPRPGGTGVSQVPGALAARVRADGAKLGTRLAGVAVVFCVPPASLAETAHHRRDRRCFVEVRRRTRPMVCFVNVESVDRILYSIFQRSNLE